MRFKWVLGFITTFITKTWQSSICWINGLGMRAYRIAEVTSIMADLPQLFTL